MLRFTKCGWKTIMLEMFYIVQRSSCQQWRGPESLAGRSHWCCFMSASKFAPIRVVQVPRSWSCERVYRACGCWHCPGISLGWKRVYRCANRDLGIRGALGGAGVGNGGAPSGIPVEDYFNLVLDGPQIQGGHIIPTANGTAQNDVKSTMGGHIPSNHGAAEFAIHTPKMVHHQMALHLRRNWLMIKLFSLQRMAGYQMGNLKRMFTSWSVWGQW